MLFRSDAQRRATFARLNNRFSHVSTGSSIADAIVNLYPSPSGVSDKTSAGKTVGDSFANAIVGLWPGEGRVDDSSFKLRYPVDDFSIEEVIAAREEFDFPKAWVLKVEGENYVLSLDKDLLRERYGGDINGQEMQTVG